MKRRDLFKALAGIALAPCAAALAPRVTIAASGPALDLRQFNYWAAVQTEIISLVPKLAERERPL